LNVSAQLFEGIRLLKTMAEDHNFIINQIENGVYVLSKKKLWWPFWFKSPFDPYFYHFF